MPELVEWVRSAGMSIVAFRHSAVYDPLQLLPQGSSVRRVVEGLSWEEQAGDDLTLSQHRSHADLMPI